MYGRNRLIDGRSDEPATRLRPAPDRGRWAQHLTGADALNLPGFLAFRAGQSLQRLFIVPTALRRPILRAMGLSLGRKVRIKARVEFYTGNVRFGDRCFVNHECLFDASARITVGDRVDFGPRVTVLTSEHAIGGPEHRAGPLSARPITIGDGAWIGGCSTILPGAVIGAGCIIAAGAVVVGETKPNSVYAGVPAKWVKDLPA